jgi:hypothetical protein
MAPERLSRASQPLAPHPRIVDVDRGDDPLLYVGHGIPEVAGVR